MNQKVLFVDDEPNILQSIRRSLRNHFNIETAESGDEALQLLRAGDQFAVIISDMRMPGMNGVELLSEVKDIRPDTVRMMLTGNADQGTAVEAINRGDIFRFLNKPCDPAVLGQAIKDAIRQHQLITAERDVLENTLRGSIRALAEVLALTRPEVFGRTTRIRRLMNRLATAMKLPDIWQIDSIAMLSLMGCVTIPEDLVKRKMGGHPLPADELKEFAAHASIGADLLSTIPRLDAIAESIRYQERNFDGTGYPTDGPIGVNLPMGARLLKVVLDFDALESSGASRAEALDRLKQHREHYDPAILATFESLLGQVSTEAPVSISIGRLTDTMILAQDVHTTSDVLLISKGQEATLSVRRHLQGFQDKGLISGQVLVFRAG